MNEFQEKVIDELNNTADILNLVADKCFKDPIYNPDGWDSDKKRVTMEMILRIILRHIEH